MKRFTLDFIPANCPHVFLPIWWVIYLVSLVGYGVYFVFYWLIYSIRWFFTPSIRAKTKTAKQAKKNSNVRK